MNEVKERLKNL